MQQNLFPEPADSFYARRAKERRDAMEQARKEGKIVPPTLWENIYAHSRAKALKAQEEQRAVANAPENNTLDSWESSWAYGLKLPPTDALVLEEKRRIING